MYIYLYLPFAFLYFSFVFYRRAGKTAVGLRKHLFLFLQILLFLYFFCVFLFCGCLFALYPDEIEVDAYFFFFCTIFLPVSSCEVFFLTATFVCRLGLRRKRGAKKYMAEVGEGGRGVFLWVCLLRKNAGETGRGEKRAYACVYIKPPKKYAGKCIHFF